MHVKENLSIFFNGYVTYQDWRGCHYITIVFNWHVYIFLPDFTWCFCPAKVARAGFWYHQSWGTKPVFTNDSETLQKVSWTPFNWWCFSATFDNTAISVVKQESHEKLYINNLTWLLKTIFCAKVVLAINFQNTSQTMCISRKWSVFTLFILCKHFCYVIYVPGPKLKRFNQGSLWLELWKKFPAIQRCRHRLSGRP